MATDFKGIAKPQRWDIPFWKDRTRLEGVAQAWEMTEAEVDRIMATPPFSQMDPQKFPAAIPLRGVIQNDTRLCRFKKGEIIVRQGDYGGSAFFILSGDTRVVLETLDETVIGRRPPKRKNVFSALQQLWNNPRLPEVRDYEAGERSGAWAAGARQAAIFVQDVPAMLDRAKGVSLHTGELFGEIAALTRAARTSTIFAETESELLEIRWQGLREIRLRASEFKAHVDRLYRERSLRSHLRETPMFHHLSDPDLEKVVAATEFQSHGDLEWYAKYKNVSELSAAQRLEMEPTIARQGHYPNGVYLIRAGFARVSQIYNHGERTMSYLGCGQTFGLEELAHNWRARQQVPFQTTLRAVGHVDVLFVPTAILEQLVFPAVDPKAWPPLHSGQSGAKMLPLASAATDKLGAEMLEFLVEKRFINGTAAMIINLDRCTRCDDCVRACAATHQNNPRFVRHGPINRGFMIANACMHCLDPVCMIGCPTGAIHRDSAHGQVVIDDLTCIGCATCANSCPYDNIQMVFPRDQDGSLYYDQATQVPIQKAVKCDLCIDQLSGVGPACANACPHDAMIRVDMRDLDALSKWLNR
ncbi:MAG TPA: cyclic nucleotide-binding domain-containing protein [Candidatus Acidoferrum sp.]|nr:cyclic nucleotide-binding domain-containing protein [Candidatus Acidoferrum sp.]